MTIKIIPYKCVCGANIKYIEKHYKTKKHQMFIKKINNTKLPEISTEQKYIIDSIQNNNVIVDSVAGSGKTTTNLFIAKSYLNLNILLLTYNSKLKIETREKIKIHEITNMEIHSYHSFCVKYYDDECFVDMKIIKLLENNKPMKKKINFNLIILDEAQDITPLYYQLICKINYDNNQQAKYCLLGDKYQSIYGFNKSDYRFLILAKDIFNFNNFNWVNTKLSTSFRISYEMSEFINNCMLNTNRIQSNKITNNKPRYIICNTFKKSENYSLTLNEIKFYLKLGYKPDEIFILASSIKSGKVPIRILENLIKTKLHNIPIYIPISDDEKLDDEVLKDKMVFSTFHQTKGLERKVVIVFNFDSSYFAFYKKNNNPKICPNELYVATTRAKEWLSLIHHSGNNYLDFINIQNLNKYCTIIGNIEYTDQYSSNSLTPIPVTDLIRNLSTEIINNCISYLHIKQIKHESSSLDIPIKTKQKNGYELVSEITGTAIPSYYELLRTSKMTIYDEILKKNYIINLHNNNNNNYFIDSNENNDFIDVYKIDLNNITPEELLLITNIYCSYRSEYIFKLYQINNYNWLSKENLNLCIERLNNLNITVKAKYEQYIEINEGKPELFNKRIKGSIDCIDNNNIYEFKCVYKLEDIHYLQVALYMYLNEITRDSNDNKLYNYYLYNILTDEMIQIISSITQLKELVSYLFHSKYFNEINISDDLFINNINNIKLQYIDYDNIHK